MQICFIFKGLIPSTHLQNIYVRYSLIIISVIKIIKCGFYKFNFLAGFSQGILLSSTIMHYILGGTL